MRIQLGALATARRIAQARIDKEAADAAVMLLGAQAWPGDVSMVAGECGHAMTGKDWVDGWRVCRNCPQLVPESDGTG